MKKCRIHKIKKRKVYLPNGKKVMRCRECDKEIKRQKFLLRLNFK